MKMYWTFGIQINIIDTKGSTNDTTSTRWSCFKGAKGKALHFFCSSTVSLTVFHVFLLIDSLYVHPSSHAIHYKKCIIPSSFHRSITTLDETIHCKHCEYPWFIHQRFCWRSRPRKQDEASKNILLGAYTGCTNHDILIYPDHSCSCHAEINAINSGNTVVHHQPTLINSHASSNPIQGSHQLRFNRYFDTEPTRAITPKHKQWIYSRCIDTFRTFIVRYKNLKVMISWNHIDEKNMKKL